MSRSYCKGAAYHGTTVGSRLSEEVGADRPPAPVASDAVSEDAPESEVESARLPLSNLRARLPWVVEDPSLTLILDMVRDARDGVRRRDRLESERHREGMCLVAEGPGKLPSTDEAETEGWATAASSTEDVDGSCTGLETEP